MTTVTGQAELSRASNPPRRPSLLQRMWTQRTDYLYVLPAFIVLMAVLTFVHEGRVALRSRR